VNHVETNESKIDGRRRSCGCQLGKIIRNAEMTRVNQEV